MKNNLKLKIEQRLSAFLLMLFVSVQIALAQGTFKVSGKIMDDLGEPMIGVSVLEKGTTNGVITDMDGNYTILVKQGATIEYSYIGYVTQTKIANVNVINLTMKEDTQALDEVVVVGYGVQKKSDLTGAISKVKESDLTNRTLSDASQALQGKSAGVYISMSSGAPGSEGTTRIRGIGTNGESRPLYVIDGSISETGIAGLNPDDIASIEVLKDGASTAIYGARAGNGVILVTTKNGSGNGKITYQFQATLQDFKNFPDVMNSKEYYDYYSENGSIPQASFDAYWDGKTDTNWGDELAEQSVMSRHSLTFQKGDKDNSIYISASYLSNNGALKGDKDTFNRLNVTLNGTWKFKPWLQLITNNQVSITKQRAIANSLMVSILRMDPLTKAYYSYDDLPAILKNVADNPKTYGELLKADDGRYFGISQFMGSGSTNPFVTLNGTDTYTKSSLLNGTTALNLTPIKGLVITSRLGYRKMIVNPRTSTGDYYSSGTSYRNYATVSATMTTGTYYQWENFANYTKEIGQHTLSAMIGTSYSQNKAYYITGSVTGSQDSDFGFLQDDPRYFYWAYRSGNAIPSVEGDEPIYNRNLSYYGRVNWNFANRYIMQVSLRADAADSSILPIDNRWGYFPAASLGWTISNEPFFTNLQKYFPYVKLRASWGQNGSTASLSNYSWSSSMTNTGFYPARTGNQNSDFSYIATYVPAYTGNKDLKWETSEQLDFGADFRFFNSRLAITIDWFKKKTKDLIINGARPSMSIGNVSSPLNAGNIENTGFELEASWQSHVGDFQYGISGNISTLKNEVTYVDPSLKAVDGLSIHPHGAVTKFETGHPAWYFYGYRFKEIDKTDGMAVFYDAEGNPTKSVTDNDLTDIGSGLPKVTAGLTLTANWKNIDFLVFASGAFGQKTYMFYDYTGYTYNKLRYYTKDRWTPSNPTGSTPVATAGDNYGWWLFSSANVMNSSYVKIKQIQLGYSIPKSVLSHIKIENIRAYVSLDDFFTITDYIGYDPEVVGVGNGQGVDQGTYPMMKKIVFGLNFTF